MSNSYRELLVWQKSFKFCSKIYLFTEELSSEEKFGLVSQMRRAAISIPSNIAEGQQRGSNKEFIRFLRIAKGSAAELSTQIMLTESLFGYDAASLNEELEELQKMLQGLIKKL